MSDHRHHTLVPLQHHRRPPHLRPGSTIISLIQKLQGHAPNSSQLVGLLTLIITGSVLLVFTGITVTASIVGMIFLAPFVIITSPVWVPISAFLFIAVVGLLSVVGSVGATVAGVAWLYRYFQGMNPPGSGGVDYARSRIYDTASNVKDYAREYGGYLQSKVKDAAPGA